MKTKLVLWGSNDQDEKLLIAMSLDADLAEVTVFTFPADVVTEAFYNQMMNVWRFNQPVEFPEGYSKIIKELSISGKLLPQGIKVDKEDLISRAQTEWQFVVLSKKMKKSFDQELEDIKERINQLTQFDGSVWEELKGFWGKVQAQTREKNLFKEHAENLKRKTNDLFSEMKQMRRKLDDEFKERSKANADKFASLLDKIESKVEEGLSLKPIFEELKSIQREFRQTTFTREDRSKIWKKLDGAFKKIKKKRFGDSDSGRNNPLNRIQRRYDGLLKAIAKMEKSIDRDEKDLEFEQNRIDNTDGQLESQIRQAKVKMIEERIRSKRDKLEDMLKTRVSLEAKIESEKQKQAQREAQSAEKKATESPQDSETAGAENEGSQESMETTEPSPSAETTSEDQDLPSQETDALDESSDTEAVASKEVPDPESTVTIPGVVSSVVEDRTIEVEEPYSEASEEEDSISGEEESDENESVSDSPVEENDAEINEQDAETHSDEAPSEETDEDESLLEAAGTAISESLEDVSDTISAVASVVGGKIKDRFNEMINRDEEE